MKSKNWILGLALIFGGFEHLNGQVVEFSGQVQADNLTNIDWVQGSKMWGTIENGNATATSANGFNSLSFGGFVPAQFSWTIGAAADQQLELGANLPPGPASMGFEDYENSAGPAVAIQFTYGADVWANGVVNLVRSEVVNDTANVGTGSGTVTLTGPGVDDAFYNEVIALTGGSGQLDYTFTAFTPVNAQGLFNSAGSFTVVPEPSEYALMFGVLGVAAVAYRRRRLAASQLA